MAKRKYGFLMKDWWVKNGMLCILIVIIGHWQQCKFFLIKWKRLINKFKVQNILVFYFNFLFFSFDEILFQKITKYIL